MILESNKIYKVVPFLRSQTLPVLEIHGTPTVYVSISQTAPKSISEMTDVTSEVVEGFNTLLGQIRYISVVLNAGDEVKESGIVSTQDTTDRLS